MLRTLKQTALAALTALSVPLVAAEPPQFDVNQIKWEMTRYSKIVDRGGKSTFWSRLPKGTEGIANKNAPSSTSTSPPLPDTIWNFP